MSALGEGKENLRGFTTWSGSRWGPAPLLIAFSLLQKSGHLSKIATKSKWWNTEQHYTGIIQQYPSLNFNSFGKQDSVSTLLMSPTAQNIFMCMTRLLFFILFFLLQYKIRSFIYWLNCDKSQITHLLILPALHFTPFLPLLLNNFKLSL